MSSDLPLSVESRDGGHRCLRLADGRFHLLKPGPLVHLFYGGGYLLASEVLAELLRRTCTHCLDLRPTEIVQIATGERFATYFEVIPHDQITPDSIKEVRSIGFHTWGFGRSHLFVTPAVADQIQIGGLVGITFSPGFSHFAA